MDNNLTQQVAAAVTEAMKVAGYTQLALSDATGIPRTTLVRRLNGHSAFTVAELAAIAGTLGIPVTTLLQGEVAA